MSTEQMTQQQDIRYRVRRELERAPHPTYELTEDLVTAVIHDQHITSLDEHDPDDLAQWIVESATDIYHGGVESPYFTPPDDAAPNGGAPSDEPPAAASANGTVTERVDQLTQQQFRELLSGRRVFLLAAPQLAVRISREQAIWGFGQARKREYAVVAKRHHLPPSIWLAFGALADHISTI